MKTERVYMLTRSLNEPEIPSLVLSKTYIKIYNYMLSKNKKLSQIPA